MADIISAFLQDTHKPSVSRLPHGQRYIENIMLSSEGTTRLMYWKNIKAQVCPRSLHFNTWKETLPFSHIPPLPSVSDTGKLDIQEVTCLLKVTKLVTGRAGLLSSMEIGY